MHVLESDNNKNKLTSYPLTSSLFMGGRKQSGSSETPQGSRVTVVVCALHVRNNMDLMSFDYILVMTAVTFSDKPRLTSAGTR